MKGQHKKGYAVSEEGCIEPSSSSPAFAISRCPEMRKNNTGISPCHVPRILPSSTCFLHRRFPELNVICQVTYCLINMHPVFLWWDKNDMYPQLPLGRSFTDLLSTEWKKQLLSFVLNLSSLIVCSFCSETMLSLVSRECSDVFRQGLTWHFLGLLQDHVSFLCRHSHP